MEMPAVSSWLPGQEHVLAETKLEAFHGKPLIQWALDAMAGLFSRRLVVTVHKEIEQLVPKTGNPRFAPSPSVSKAM